MCGALAGGNQSPEPSSGPRGEVSHHRAAQLTLRRGRRWRTFTTGGEQDTGWTGERPLGDACCPHGVAEHAFKPRVSSS
ncbi:hypothetical protein H8959_020544 [Pygathrix nigripes]